MTHKIDVTSHLDINSIVKLLKYTYFKSYLYYGKKWLKRQINEPLCLGGRFAL